MRIQVTRTWGHATPLSVLLDTEGRPDAPHIHAVVREALGACGPARSPFPSPEGCHYEIRVDGRPVGHCAEPNLTGSQRELVALVLGPVATAQ